MKPAYLCSFTTLMQRSRPISRACFLDYAVLAEREIREMFQSAIAINSFQSQLLLKIAKDLNDESLYIRAPGHGHPPAWILGHIAITGELGQRILGGRISHPRWLTWFGPGSSDEPEELKNQASFTLSELAAAVSVAYEGFRELANKDIDVAVANAPHGFELFAGSPIQTVADMVTLLLTNHYAFHLSQLSSCRRSTGHKYLF